MKILWVCNIIPPAIAKRLNMPYSNREGWLSGLLDRVVGEQDRNHIDLAIAFPVDETVGPFDQVMQMGENMSCHCYAFVEDGNAPEKYDVELEDYFHLILDDFQPDIMHIFGTEFPHTLAAVRVFQKPEHTLIGIQGLISACAKVYMSDLPVKVQRQVTLRDMLRKDSIRQQQKKFEKRGVYEIEAIRSVKHIAGRTDFDREEVARINPSANYHYLNETLRSTFYRDRWQKTKCQTYRIFMSQGDYPLKGFHYMLQAMPKILEQFPDTELYVAGANIISKETWKDRLKRPAYGKYLLKLIKTNHLENKVFMLGKLDADQMKEQYLASHVFVCPSALENSPNSVGEAMLLGVPCVAANVGGIHNLLTDGGDGFLYPPGDVDALAGCVIEIFNKEAIVDRITDNARKHARTNHDADQNYYRLLRIYREMLS
jgi:glycosyltransferase involved in cell wall biosynthesis